MRVPLVLLAALLLVVLGWSFWRAEGPAAGRVFPERPAAPPRRVLPANAGAADLCLALLEPERVAALPQAAFEYSRVGQESGRWSALPRFQGFDTESLLAHRPDLVLAHGWQSPETLASLRRSGVYVLVLPLPLVWDDVREAVRACGRAFGEEARAAQLLAELDRRVELLRARAGAERLAALSYVNLGTGGWAAGKGTTADILFELAGLRNAAAEAGLEGHATLDHEGLLVMDPDVIVVGVEGDGDMRPTEAYLRAEPSLASLRALREGRVVGLPQRLFTTSSTELVAGAELLAQRLAEGGWVPR